MDLEPAAGEADPGDRLTRQVPAAAADPDAAMLAAVLARTGAVRLPSDEPSGWPPQPWGSDCAVDALRSLVRLFSSSREPLSYRVSVRSGQSGTALAFRILPARSVHVVGADPLAGELRRLIAAGAEPGWDLHPVPGGRTPLRALAAPLHRLSGNGRFYSVLDRAGFAFAEEVAATPDECLMDLRNAGPAFMAAVRQVTCGLALYAPPCEAPPDALDKLALAVAGARYAPLRRRAASRFRPGPGTPGRDGNTPAWLEGLLRWLPR